MYSVHMYMHACMPNNVIYTNQNNSRPAVNEEDRKKNVQCDNPIGAKPLVTLVSHSTDGQQIR